MHIILKDILKLTNVSYCLFFVVFGATGSEDVVLRQYGYGSLQWSSAAHKKPGIYPLLESNLYITAGTKTSDIRPFYKISDAESESEQVRTGVKLTLKVEQKDGYALATVSFKNYSAQSYFVHKHNLPYIYSDVPKYSSHCSNMFLITADNIRLDYLSGWCEYKSNIERDAWVEIPARKKFRFTTRLNDAYQFLPGKRRYNIGTLDYSLVNAHWFLEQKINKSLFSILSWKYTCTINNDENLLLDWDSLCQKRHGQDNVEGFLFNLSYLGSSNDIIIRSNQVVIEIDGNELVPFYNNRSVILTAP